MRDLISRQAVLKLLSAIPPEDATTKALLIQSVKQMDAPDNLVKDSQGLAKELVNDTISRKAAIDIVEFECGEWSGLAKTIAEEIKQLPSAQPEIVMCKDCKKYIDYRCRDEHANLSDWRHEDDYCSYGKRREVNE